MTIEPRPLPADAAWHEGWWRGARHVPSPNHGPRPEGTAIDLIVVHSISLPPGCFDGDAVEALFCNRLDWDAHPYYQQIRGLEVSAHFLIRRDGKTVQFVSVDRRAWHAGASTWKGRANCNDYSVGIELEGLEGEVFDDRQYPALVRLCQSLALRWPIDAIAGHEHVSPGRKLDPGAGFDWCRLQQALAWPARCFPEWASPGAPLADR